MDFSFSPHMSYGSTADPATTSSNNGGVSSPSRSAMLNQRLEARAEQNLDTTHDGIAHQTLEEFDIGMSSVHHHLGGSTRHESFGPGRERSGSFSMRPQTMLDRQPVRASVIYKTPDLLSSTSFRTTCDEETGDNLQTPDHSIGLSCPDESIKSSYQHETDSASRGTTTTTLKSFRSGRCNFLQRAMQDALQQAPAVIIMGFFYLLSGIPFGVSYFPIGWASQSEGPGDAAVEEEHGMFPLPGKEALGIRMFLFASFVGQVVFTWTSGFVNPIGLQMVENVPFCHALASNTFRHAGYGLEAFSTLVFMFGLASVMVGFVFYTLGYFKLGRIIYYFPTHVLVGCIGGIGLFIIKTGVEVTANATLKFSWQFFWEYRVHLGIVVGAEVLLRALENITKHRYSLLAPLYFCLMTPAFYGVLFAFDISFSDAKAAGYLFPSLASSGDSGMINGFKPSLFEYWAAFDIKGISWPAVVESIPTLMALVIFSLVHVPINIPAFAISSNADVDMNTELVSHGYANFLAGIFGGLQTYMTYTQSVLYDRSGGRGKASGMAVAAVVILLYIEGPTLAAYIPRCMAGTLLLHVGIDLFVEGVYDSYGKFDKLEYSGIWIIALVMCIYGMDAAMVAGVIAAVSTYAVQSITLAPTPIRSYRTASSLQSSHWNRGYKASAILDSPQHGRSRILVIQLQGHLFFGNLANLTEELNALFKDGLEKSGESNRWWIVIIDCSLVTGIDSSAAHAMVKLRNSILGKYHIPLCFWVSGSSDGFPCEYDLSNELPTAPTNVKDDSQKKHSNSKKDKTSESAHLLGASSNASIPDDDSCRYRGSHVCESLDWALMYAEDSLVYRQEPHLLVEDVMLYQEQQEVSQHPSSLTEDEENEFVIQYLSNICPTKTSNADIVLLKSFFEREVYHCGEYLWRQGDASDCAKMLISGKLVSFFEEDEMNFALSNCNDNVADDEEVGRTVEVLGRNRAHLDKSNPKRRQSSTTQEVAKEVIPYGHLMGEFGLVQSASKGGNFPRKTSVQCVSPEGAIVYNISRKKFDKLLEEHPRIARFIDLLCIKYLGNRVQHVSNRIFETRCLPV